MPEIIFAGALTGNMLFVGLSGEEKFVVVGGEAV